jgi:hypothetical protein
VFDESEQAGGLHRELVLQQQVASASCSTGTGGYGHLP